MKRVLYIAFVLSILTILLGVLYFCGFKAIKVGYCVALSMISALFINVYNIFVIKKIINKDKK